MLTSSPIKKFFHHLAAGTVDGGPPPAGGGAPSAPGVDSTDGGTSCEDKRKGKFCWGWWWCRVEKVEEEKHGGGGFINAALWPDGYVHITEAKILELHVSTRHIVEL